MQKAKVFDEIYQDYLNQLGGVDLAERAARLGLESDGSMVEMPLFGRMHQVSPQGVIGPDGQRPSHARAVVLFQSLLLAPEAPPPQGEWVSYRDFADTRPFAQGFVDTAETPLVRDYGDRPEQLAEDLARLGGAPARVEASYDVAMELLALPRLPLLVLFNEAFPPLPAAASILLKENADHYLDAECRAILGMILPPVLRELHGTPTADF